MLFNLLDNAAKYAAPGTTILIRTWRDRHSVALQVIDEGEGIPQDDLGHILSHIDIGLIGGHIGATSDTLPSTFARPILGARSEMAEDISHGR